MKKSIAAILAFFVLALLQVSFFPHFAPQGFVPNIPVLALIAFATSASRKSGLQASFAAGFVLDAYSALPFGFWILLCSAVFLASRRILQHYVRVPRVV